MIASILKILSGILDLPRYYDRIKSYFLQNKVEKLEIEIAKKDATIAVERLENKVSVETKENRKAIEDEVHDETLDDISKYFGSK